MGCRTPLKDTARSFLLVIRAPAPKGRPRGRRVGQLSWQRICALPCGPLQKGTTCAVWTGHQHSQATHVVSRN